MTFNFLIFDKSMKKLTNNKKQSPNFEALLILNFYELLLLSITQK